MSTTRFPHGVTNITSTSTLGAMGQLDPTKYLTIFDDLTGTASAWGAALTIAAGQNGVATLATTTSASTPQKIFLLDPAKEMYFKAQFSLATVSGNSANIGFADSIASPTKGVYLEFSGGTTVTLNIIGSATTSDEFTVSVADATMASVGLSYTPSQGIKVYLNDQVIGSETDMSNLDSTDLLYFGLYSNGATATVDYLFAAQER